MDKDQHSPLTTIVGDLAKKVKSTLVSRVNARQNVVTLAISGTKERKKWCYWTLR